MRSSTIKDNLGRFVGHPRIENLIKQLDQQFIKQILTDISVPHDRQSEIPQEMKQELEERYGKEGAQKFDYFDTEGLIALSRSEEQAGDCIKAVWQQCVTDLNCQELIANCIQEIGLRTLDAALFFELLEDLMLTYFYYRYAYGMLEEPFHLCDCAEAPLEKRILSILYLVDEIRAHHSSSHFDYAQRFVYTSFAAGGLFHDFLTLKILARWYTYFSLYFIDELYPEALQEIKANRLTMLDHFVKDLQKTGAIFDIRLFTTVSDYLKEQQKLAKPTVLVTVDLGEEGYWWFLQEDMQTTLQEYELKETVNALFLTYNQVVFFACYFHNPATVHSYISSKTQKIKSAQDIVQDLTTIARQKLKREDIFAHLYAFTELLPKNQWGRFWISYPYGAFQDLIKYSATTQTIIMQLSQNAILLANRAEYSAADIVEQYAGRFLKSKKFYELTEDNV